MKKIDIKNIKNKKKKAFILYLLGKVLALMFIFFSLVLLVAPTIVLAADSVTILDNRIEDVDGKSVKAVWRTDVGTKGKIIFGETANDLHYYIVDGDGYKTYHEVELGNLKPETTYYYQIIAYSTYEQATSFVKSFKTEKHNDGIGPQISEVSIPFVSGTLALVSWKTDEDGTSVVEYGENESYSSRVYNNARKKDHVIILKNLKVDQNYFIRMYSVDKDNNRSTYNYRSFRTRINNSIDTADLEIKNFRPAGLKDAQVTDNSVTVSFQTNRYAKGKVTISRSGFRSQSQELDYNSSHQVAFAALSANTQYKITISLNDVFGKSKTEIFEVFTKEASSAPVKIVNNASVGVDNSVGNSSSQFVSGVNDSQYCTTSYVNSKGYYGQYFNLPDNAPNINSRTTTKKGYETGWFDSKYYVFSKIDTSLDYEGEFLPISGTKYRKDPYYFSVYWRAILEVPATGSYEYSVRIDDSGWLYVDNVLVADMSNRLPLQEQTKQINLSKGIHYLEFYFTERGPRRAMVNFVLDPKIITHPWPVNCSLLPVGAVNSSNNNSNNNGNSNSSDIGGDDNIIVAGAEHSYYTEATALLKTYDSPDIYAIMNGQLHYISSPASFAEYGFSWLDIKIVTQVELEKYPRARLIKSPEKSTIYYLYQRPEGQWLKININSPTVFVSYLGNYWGNVITVTQLDVDSYPDVKLIKTKNSSEVYYLENNSRRKVSAEVFKARGFNIYEISEVNDTHLESYLIGNQLK